MKKNYFAFIGLLLSFCFSSSATTPEELIFDAGFETYPVGTISDNAVDFATPKDYKMFKYMPLDQGANVANEIIEFPTEDPIHGWQCLKLTVSGTLTANYSGWVINYTDGITLVAGKSYEVKYSVKTSAAIQASTIRIANSIGGHNDSQAFKFWHGSDVISLPINEWRDISFVYIVAESGAVGYWDTMLAAGVSIQPIITPARLSAAGGSISIYLDNFSIKEYVPNALPKNEVENKDIFISNNTLHINSSENTSYQIFNIAGVAVEKGLISGNMFSKTMDIQAGIYIVKAGNKIAKVSLK